MCSGIPGVVREFDMDLATFDSMVLSAVQGTGAQWLDTAMLAVTFLGNPLFWIMIATAMLWLGRDRNAFFLMNLVVFSAAAVSVLKVAFSRPRPAIDQFRVLVASYDPFSFPSGHATLAGAAYSFLSREFKRWKWVLLAAALAVAYSRMYLGVHYLSDVVVGLALGYIVGFLGYEVKKRLDHSQLKITKLEEGAGAIIVVLAALAVFALLEPPILSAVVFGWYAGYFILKEQDAEMVVRGLAWQLKALAFGFASLGIVLVAALAVGPVSGEAEIAVLFIAGAWASYGFPAVYGKFAGKTRASNGQNLTREQCI